MNWLLIALGSGVGIILGYLIADRRSRTRELALQTATATADQRCLSLADQLEKITSENTTLRTNLSTAEKNTATLTAQYQAAQQNLLEQKNLLDDAQRQLRDAFALVSAEALAKNNEAFLQLAKERFATLSTEATGSLDQRKAQIETLLKPMQELLAHYQSRLAEIEKSRVESYSMLREQLGTLAETQRTLNTQTSQLVTALSRPSTRGQWGEISLRRLVELAGMTKRCDFIEQNSIGTEDGRLRPDMVVHLPGQREIIIDCKATLDAFLDASAAVDQDQRKLHLQRHCQHVRTRSRELSAKSYWSQFPRSPEYVVMFLPGEAFLYAAVEMDGGIIEESLKNRVIIATPTTLIALLKAIEFGWRQEDITENAEKIRKLGVELYDRIATLASHIDKLGTSLGGAINNYNNAIGSLETRVFVTARKISELGAHTEKEIPDLQQITTHPRQLPATLNPETP